MGDHVIVPVHSWYTSLIGRRHGYRIYTTVDPYTALNGIWQWWICLRFASVVIQPKRSKLALLWPLSPPHTLHGSLPNSGALVISAVYHLCLASPKMGHLAYLIADIKNNSGTNGLTSD